MKSSNLPSGLYTQLGCTAQDLEAAAFDVKTACQLFEAQAVRVPEQTALWYQESKLSYQQLNAISNQLARHIRSQYQQLTAQDLKPNTLIPISMARSADFVIGILAILKAGGAYVPINPDYPEPRIQHILSECQSSFILTEPALFERFQSFDENLQPISIDRQQLAHYSQNNIDMPLTANDLAYVIYTSGSSGTPKGVMARHATLISQTVCASYFYADENDTVAFFSDVSFDSTTTEIWGALLSGARLYIPDDFFELMSNPDLFKRRVIEKKLSIILLTRALFDLLYSMDETVFADVEFMMVGGEALTKPIMLKLAQSKYKPSLLINAYGPTENSTFCTTYTIHEDFSQYHSVPIGRPYSNRIGLVLDKHLQLLPLGVTGELFVSGTSLSLGYLNQPEITAEKFIDNPYFAEFSSLYPKIYRTNDLVKWLPEGNLEYIARNDFMVKLRGYRIELGEIETRMAELPEIAHSVVIMDKNESLSYLVGYYVAEKPLADEILRAHLSQTLPDYMIPSVFFYLKTLPVTTNGKLDRKALPKVAFQTAKPETEENPLPQQSLKQIIRDIWANILNIEHFNADVSFFNLGGNSLSAMVLRKELEQRFSVKLNIVDIFQYPSVNSLASRLTNLLKASGNYADFEDKPAPKETLSSANTVDEPIAIVGMACRLPGIKNAAEYWSLLLEGKSNLRDFSEEELLQNQVSEKLIHDENYVKRGAVFADPYAFDANFFGYSVKDAEWMDPQHRQFLECAWEALEDSGTVVENHSAEIGVFASQGRSHYFMDRVYPMASKDQQLFQAILGNEKDFLSSRVSYKFDLTGPSITTQTACSSSLVSVQLACESLKNGSCDIALAGGVSLFYNHGYPYQEALIESPDGYCRAFDAEAKGTVITSGVGIVVLKKLSTALADQDRIYALIKGGAVNNDGASKMAFTAPSIKGQSAVIQKALKNAGIQPDSIDYIEAHGTGTLLGDPIEWAALHQVYAKYSDKAGYCTIGAAKTNIGHTDSAAGVLGLMKAALALQEQTMPATVNFERLNPEIAAFNRLFKVSNQSLPWPADKKPRRAAVSSFGLGGSNAHMILEEYLATDSAEAESDSLAQSYVIPVSAKDPEALFALLKQYERYLHQASPDNFAAIAYTAQFGRTALKERACFIVSSNGMHELSPILKPEKGFDLPWYLAASTAVCSAFMSAGSCCAQLIEQLFLQWIATLWISGIAIDWLSCQSFPKTQRKVSLPNYCFQHSHYEISKEDQPMLESQEDTVQESIENLSVEAQLKQLWVDVLGVNETTLCNEADFLDLGGDSLSYIDLFNHIKKIYPTTFSLEALIEFSGFAEMCEFIRSEVCENEPA